MSLREVTICLRAIGTRRATDYACQAALHNIRLDPEVMLGNSEPAEDDLTDEQTKILEREMARQLKDGAKRG